MTTRARIVAFGSAALLVVAGVVLAAAIGGDIGPYLSFALIGLGLVAVVSLVFLEVGLSEDRERASDRRRLRRRLKRPKSPKLERSRGHRRRLG